MDALGNVLEDEVLILHCHETGDCHEPDNRHSKHSRVSELFHQLMVANQNAYAFRPNSMIVKKRMPWSLVGAMTKMMPASSVS